MKSCVTSSPLCLACISFTAGGRRIVLSGADQTVRIWGVESAKHQTVLHGHLTKIYRVEPTADGGGIVGGAKDGSLLVWDAKRKERRARFKTIPTPVERIEFLPGGNEFLAVDPVGFVTLWDSSTLQPLGRIGCQPVKDSSAQAGTRRPPKTRWLSLALPIKVANGRSAIAVSPAAILQRNWPPAGAPARFRGRMPTTPAPIAIKAHVAGSGTTACGEAITAAAPGTGLNPTPTDQKVQGVDARGEAVNGDLGKTKKRVGAAGKIAIRRSPSCRRSFRSADQTAC